MQLLQGPKAEHKVEFCRLLLGIEKVKKKKLVEVGCYRYIVSSIPHFIDAKYLRLRWVRHNLTQLVNGRNEI